jgi:hypothetical protein
MPPGISTEPSSADACSSGFRNDDRLPERGGCDSVNHDIVRLVESAEARAYASLMQAAPAALGFRAEQVGSATLLIASSLKITLFNRVIGLGVGEPATERAIDGMLDTFGREGIGNFAVHLSPAAQPAALAMWLSNRGLVPKDNWTKAYRQARPAAPVPTDLRIERIGPESAGAFARVACEAFQMPDMLRPWLEAGVGRSGWRHYLAYDENRPVATGALHVENHVGWLGLAGTLPSHRRRGAQGALMSARINDAAALGCVWLATETAEDTAEHPNPSFHNMLRTGFTVAYQRPNFMLEQ